MSFHWQPHITGETAAARLASRLDRQRRALGRDDPPSVWFLVDELSLYRQGLSLRFDTLRGECYRVSESVALLERLEGIWKAGASPLTQTATAATA